MKGYLESIWKFGSVKTCKVCGIPMVPGKIPNFGEIERDVAVAVYDMPFLSCPQRHERAFAYPDFPSEMLGKIFAGMPTAVEKGFVSKKRFCCRCRRPLSEAMVEEGKLTIYVTLRDLEEFKVEVGGLLWRCPLCQQQQVFRDRKMLSAFPEAIAKGFDSVNLKTG